MGSGCNFHPTKKRQWNRVCGECADHCAGDSCASVRECAGECADYCYARISHGYGLSHTPTASVRECAASVRITQRYAG